jgi:hypothetical protein
VRCSDDSVDAVTDHVKTLARPEVSILDITDETDGTAEAIIGYPRVWSPRCTADEQSCDAAVSLGRRLRVLDPEFVRLLTSTIRRSPTVSANDEALEMETSAQKWSVSQPSFRIDVNAQSPSTLTTVRRRTLVNRSYGQPTTQRSVPEGMKTRGWIGFWTEYGPRPRRRGSREGSAPPSGSVREAGPMVTTAG